VTPDFISGEASHPLSRWGDMPFLVNRANVRAGKLKTGQCKGGTSLITVKLLPPVML